MKLKILSVLIILLVMLSISGMSLAEDQGENINDIELYSIMTDLSGEIEKDILSNYEKLGITIGDDIKRVVVFDHTKDIEMIRRSFNEPIVIYEERIEQDIISPKAITPISDPITKVVYNGNGNKRVTYTANINAYVRSGGQDPKTGSDILEYKLTGFDFGWSTNSTYLLDGVHSVDYELQQKNYTDFFNNFHYGKVYNFPDHHSFGSFNINVSPDKWAAICEGWGYAVGSGEVKIYFDGTGYKYDIFSAGWGGIIP